MRISLRADRSLSWIYKLTEAMTKTSCSILNQFRDIKVPNQESLRKEFYLLCHQLALGPFPNYSLFILSLVISLSIKITAVILREQTLKHSSGTQAPQFQPLKSISTWMSFHSIHYILSSSSQHLSTLSVTSIHIFVNKQMQ